MQCKAVLGAFAAGLLLAGCGGDGGVDLPFAATADLQPAEPCPGASAVEDPAGDSTGPNRDLRRFEMSSTQDGVCVRWTTEAQAVVGTKLVLVAHGPPQTHPSGNGSVAYGYGFDVELTEDGAEVTYGLADAVNDTPNVLDARVGQSGERISAFVPRSELDRPPANTPDRPPFPYNELMVEARVSEELGGIADSWPDEPGTQASYVNGQLCTACPQSLPVP